MATAGTVARASLHPLSLGVGAGAAVLAVGLGSLPVGVVGGVAYLAMVAFRAARSHRQRSALAELRMLPDPKTITNADTRAAVEHILSSRRELQKVLDDTPPEVIAGLTRTLESLHVLEGHAGRLVERAEDIAKYLAGVDLPALVAEVRRLTLRAQDASHPDARNSFEEAKEARMQEIRALKELKATKDKLDGNLMRIVAVLTALPTKVVHMRALDAQALDRMSGDVSADLEAVGTELVTSEEVVAQLAKPAPRKVEA